MNLPCQNGHPCKECSSHKERNAQHHSAVPVSQIEQKLSKFSCVYCQKPIQQKGWSFSCGTCHEDICPNCWLYFIKRDSILKQNNQPKMLDMKCAQLHPISSFVNEGQIRRQCGKYDQKYLHPTVSFLCSYCQKGIKQVPMLACPKCLLFMCGDCSIETVLSGLEQYKMNADQSKSN